MTAAARIMVATEVVADADLVMKLLREEFDEVVVSTDPGRAVQDFEKHQPEVLILAFNTLEKAERYYLGLYRLGTLVHAPSQVRRTVRWHPGRHDHRSEREGRVVESLKAGASDFVVKPFDKNMLLAKVQQILNGASAPG